MANSWRSGNKTTVSILRVVNYVMCETPDRRLGDNDADADS